MRKLFLLLPLLAVLITSCSKDDSVDHMGSAFAVEMSVETNYSYRATKLHFFAKDITIDWGDGSEPYHYGGDDGSSWSSKDIEHAYPEVTATTKYTIKISGKGLDNLQILRAQQHSDYGGSIIRSVDLKSCPDLQGLSLLEVADMQTFDFSNCPQLASFSLSGWHGQSLDLSKYALQSFGSEANTDLNSLKLNSSLTSLYMDYTRNLTTANFDLKQFKNLENFTIQNMIWTSVDLSACTNLTTIHIQDVPLTSLDLSKNTKLTSLDCENTNVTSIAMKPDSKFKYLIVSHNKLTAEALNAIFATLPTVTPTQHEEYKIYINNNPGTDTCDKTIATKKGWKFH